MSSMEGLRQMYCVSQGQGLSATFCSLGRTGRWGSVQGCSWLKQETKGRPKQTAPDPLAGIVLDVIPGMSWHTQ